MNRTFLKRWIDPKKVFGTNKRRQRQSVFVSFFLILILIILTIITGIDFSDQIANPSPAMLVFLGQDAFMILAIGLLLLLNRRGFTLLAAYGFIAICMVGILLTLNDDTLLYSVLFFSLPIMAASFIIHPRASAGVAALGIIFYLGTPSSYAMIASGSVPMFLGNHRCSCHCVLVFFRPVRAGAARIGAIGTKIYRFIRKKPLLCLSGRREPGGAMGVSQ